MNEYLKPFMSGTIGSNSKFDSVVIVINTVEEERTVKYWQDINDLSLTLGRIQFRSG